MVEDVFRDPWREFDEVWRRADELFDAFLKRFEGPESPPLAFVPQCDVVRTPGEYIFRIALPGVLEEDIDLTIDGEILTVRGEREDPLAPGGGEIVRREFRDGYFERRFSLPFAIRPEGVRAEFSEGVLIVRVERPEA